MSGLRARQAEAYTDADAGFAPVGFAALDARFAGAESALPDTAAGVAARAGDDPVTEPLFFRPTDFDSPPVPSASPTPTPAQPGYYPPPAQADVGWTPAPPPTFPSRPQPVRAARTRPNLKPAATPETPPARDAADSPPLGETGAVGDAPPVDPGLAASVLTAADPQAVAAADPVDADESRPTRPGERRRARSDVRIADLLTEALMAYQNVRDSSSASISTLGADPSAGLPGPTSVPQVPITLPRPAASNVPPATTTTAATNPPTGQFPRPPHNPRTGRYRPQHGANPSAAAAEPPSHRQSQPSHQQSQPSQPIGPPLPGGSGLDSAGLTDGGYAAQPRHRSDPQFGDARWSASRWDV